LFVLICDKNLFFFNFLILNYRPSDPLEFLANYLLKESENRQAQQNISEPTPSTAAPGATSSTSA